MLRQPLNDQGILHEPHAFIVWSFVFGVSGGVGLIHAFFHAFAEFALFVGQVWTSRAAGFLFGGH
jgi:hypothetical protein